MVRKKKIIIAEPIEFPDEYFINLTMKYDEKDNDIYLQWAKWCDLSKDKYYIDGKNGYFYTHVRSTSEIDIERKRHEIIELLANQDHSLGTAEEWQKYERYILENSIDPEKVLNFIPMYFTEWKENQ